MENFKAVNEFPGYLIGDLGTIVNKYGRVRKPKLLPNGYQQISIRVKGVKKLIYLHRLIAMAWVENPDHKPEVNHEDGVKINNTKANLTWVTRSENVIHGYRVLGRKRMTGASHGMFGIKKDLSGVKNPNHKLYRLWQGDKLIKEDIGRELANYINCSVSAISLSANGKRGLIHKKYHTTYVKI